MKGKDWLVLGGLGLALWYFGKKGATEGGGGGGGAGFEFVPPVMLTPQIQLFQQESGAVIKSSAFQGSQFRVIGQVDRPLLQQAGAIASPTLISYNQNLLSQPKALEGVTWKSGTPPQQRPDQYWVK